MLDLSDFIYIDADNFRVGIDGTEASLIAAGLTPGKIKKEHIEASSPSRIVAAPPFYISKKLVTVAQFSEFVKAASYISESEREGWGWVWEASWKKRDGVSWKSPFGDDSDRIYRDNADIFPVMQVSWNDAVAYTEWRSHVEGKTIRIPAEIEWEIFAAKAGVRSIAETADGMDQGIKNSADFIHLLQKKMEDSLYNIGLLWEWTLDWYNSYSPEIEAKDFGNVYKVLRGGSLLSEEIQKSREFRFRRCPTARSPYYGFRIVFLVS